MIFTLLKMNSSQLLVKAEVDALRTDIFKSGTVLITIIYFR